jgi:CheY-like chemotaxis protein
MKMPEMDGIEVLSSIRKFSAVPVIIMTAYSTIERAEKCADLGVQGYVRKPFDSYDLLDKVKEC